MKPAAEYDTDNPFVTQNPEIECDSKLRLVSEDAWRLFKSPETDADLHHDSNANPIQKNHLELITKYATMYASLNLAKTLNKHSFLPDSNWA